MKANMVPTNTATLRARTTTARELATTKKPLLAKLTVWLFKRLLVKAYNALLNRAKLLDKMEQSEQPDALSPLEYWLVLDFSLNEQANADWTDKKRTTTIK